MCEGVKLQQWKIFFHFLRNLTIFDLMLQTSSLIKVLLTTIRNNALQIAYLRTIRRILSWIVWLEVSKRIFYPDCYLFFLLHFALLNSASPLENWPLFGLLSLTCLVAKKKFAIFKKLCNSIRAPIWKREEAKWFWQSPINPRWVCGISKSIVWPTMGEVFRSGIGAKRLQIICRTFDDGLSEFINF